MTVVNLAYIPSPPQGVWYLGPIPLRAYALCIIVGIIAALMIGDRRWVARGGERGVIYDIALWAVPFGLVGGRLYHVMTDWTTYFGAHGKGLGKALAVWEGGLGIWGAVALGGVGAWIACRRRGIPLPAFGDAIAPGIVLAQAIGRLGNYFNQELTGGPTTLPWGLELFERKTPDGVVDVLNLYGVSTGEVAAIVHPTFLYEMLWNIFVFVVLILIDQRFKIGHGRVFALYVALYCVGRFFVELIRIDHATQFGSIRINSFTSVLVFLGAVAYVLLAPKGREDPSTLGGEQHATEEDATEEDGTEDDAAKDEDTVEAAADETDAAIEEAEEEAEEETETESVEQPAETTEAVEPAESGVEVSAEKTEQKKQGLFGRFKRSAD